MIHPYYRAFVEQMSETIQSNHVIFSNRNKQILSSEILTPHIYFFSSGQKARIYYAMVKPRNDTLFHHQQRKDFIFNANVMKGSLRPKAL